MFLSEAIFRQVLRHSVTSRVEQAVVDGRGAQKQHLSEHSAYRRAQVVVAEVMNKSSASGRETTGCLDSFLTAMPS